jgi:hypothetical protein
LQLSLFGRLHGAEENGGITEQLLHRLHRVAFVGVERRQLLGDGLGIGAERADVFPNQRGERLAKTADREQRVSREFLSKHPHPHLVGGDAPLLGEPIDVAGQHADAGVLAGDGQVVLPEHLSGHATDHRADGHAHHRRRHHLAEPGHHCHHRVAFEGRGRPRRARWFSAMASW